MSPALPTPARPARLWPLAALALLILFPLGWVGELWPAFGAALGLVFATAREHAVGHAALFFLLGASALATFPALRRRPWRFLALLLLAGVAQELLQLAYKQRPLEYDDARDLATDLAGAALALGAWRLAARIRRKTE